VGSVGLMGALADRSSITRGPDRVIPEFLVNREHMLVSRADASSRRQARAQGAWMFERADAFVSLPVGVPDAANSWSTTDLAQLGRHKNPIRSSHRHFLGGRSVNCSSR